MTPWFRPALLSCTLITLAGCGGALKYDMRGTQLSPGSDAKLEAKVDSARNLTQFELHATNLTPPGRVLENGTTYVVWTRHSDATPWMRLGALELVDEGRAGSASLTVSEVAFDLLISAEVNAQGASPSGKTLFEQRVQE